MAPIRLSTVLLCVIVSLICWIEPGTGQSPPGSDRRCHAYENSCSHCIQEPGCQWCSKFDGVQGNSSNLRRCYSDSDVNTVCQAGKLVNPINRITVTRNDSLTEISDLDSKLNVTIVQLAPQEISLQLRKNDPMKFTFKFRLATDYPIDLYYLMDLSKSMADDKANLAALGSNLALKMQNLTTQFRLGFGSYVDKVVSPYANVHPNKVLSPCAGCAPPYSFHNNLPLNVNPDLFEKHVKEAPISGNVDSPEGGLDALLQAIVCPDIGWSKEARRLLILSTDAKFHHAGDGRLAGIVTPHDGECHLNVDGEYTHFDQLDYPSISQINTAAREHQVNIIFAVSNYDSLYKSLSDQIAYSSQGMLDDESSNVVELVENQYNQISSEVQLTDNVGSIPGSPLAIRYYTKCLNAQGPMRQTNICYNVKEGNEIEFTAEIEVVNIPDRQVYGTSFQFNITTLQDTLTVTVEIESQCDCEDPSDSDYEINSKDCTYAGNRQCGVCSCSDSHYGNRCQCSADASSQDDNKEDAIQCLADPTEPQNICSGKGTCECGTCICDPPFEGTFCECNNEKCKHNGAGGQGSSSNPGGTISVLGSSNVCSGRGTCGCGACKCLPGFAGDFCECPDDRACVAPNTDSDETCSGKGDCSCGECSCHSVDTVLYTGRYCEECSTCSTGKCKEFKDCVQCQIHQSGPLAEYDCGNCTTRPTILSSLEGQLREGARLCTFLDEKTGCDFNFTYEYTPFQQKYVIFAQSYQICPDELDVLLVVFGVIGGVVAIGLFTLILWKILTTIHDRREFARFQEESKNVKFGANENVIYKPATVTFQNPSCVQTATK